MPKSNLKKLIAVAGSLVGGGIALATVSVVAVLSHQKPGCACGNPAISNVGAAIYEQMEHHIEQGRFSDAPLETLTSRVPGKVERYRYSSQVQDETAYAYATPKQAYFQAEWGPFKGKKQPVFHGAVSAVTFDEKTQNYVRITCIAKEASDRKPPTPTFDGQTFACPEGMDKRE